MSDNHKKLTEAIQDLQIQSNLKAHFLLDHVNNEQDNLRTEWKSDLELGLEQSRTDTQCDIMGVESRLRATIVSKMDILLQQLTLEMDTKAQNKTCTESNDLQYPNTQSKVTSSPLVPMQ